MCVCSSSSFPPSSCSILLEETGSISVHLPRSSALTAIINQSIANSGRLIINNCLRLISTPPTPLSPPPPSPGPIVSCHRVALRERIIRVTSPSSIHRKLTSSKISVELSHIRIYQIIHNWISLSNEAWFHQQPSSPFILNVKWIKINGSSIRSMELISRVQLGYFSDAPCCR